MAGQPRPFQKKNFSACPDLLQFTVLDGEGGGFAASIQQEWTIQVNSVFFPHVKQTALYPAPITSQKGPYLSFCGALHAFMQAYTF